MAEKKKPGRPKKTAAKKTPQPAIVKAEKPLPPPIDVDLNAAVEPEKQNDPFGLSSVFQSSNRPQLALPSSSASPASSTAISEPVPGAPLDDQAERMLNRVPGKIAEGDQDEPLPDGGDSPEPDVIASLMAEVAFEEQDVKDVLCEFFDWLAVRFENDNWKLTDRQSRMLGKASFQLANSMWFKLQNLLPDIIARWCAETPGAMAFISACGLVVIPKVLNQVKVSRQRKAARQRVQEMQPGSHRPAQVQRPGPAVVPRTVDQSVGPMQ